MDKMILSILFCGIALKHLFSSKSHVFHRKIIISSFKFIPGGLRGEGNTVFWGNRETMGTPIKTMDKMSISQNAE